MEMTVLMFTRLFSLDLVQKTRIMHYTILSGHLTGHSCLGNQYFTIHKSRPHTDQSDSKIVAGFASSRAAIASPALAPTTAPIRGALPLMTGASTSPVTPSTRRPFIRWIRSIPSNIPAPPACVPTQAPAARNLWISVHGPRRCRVAT